MFSPKRYLRITRSKTSSVPNSQDAGSGRKCRKPLDSTMKENFLTTFTSRQLIAQNICVDERKRFRDEEKLQGDEVEVGNKTIDDMRTAEKSCRCSRSKCLKQYCLCFRRGECCESECICVGCMNDGKHEKERIAAVRRVRFNSTAPFKGTSLSTIIQSESDSSGLERGYRGCRCKKSRCQKKVLHTNCFSSSPILDFCNNCCSIVIASVLGFPALVYAFARIV
jgi:hypothetical protein